ncbi:MAG: hypothetical protein HC905_01890 [Bacteroidales bacterium]|nr:hypothetical protein [Bacteroidales bacterium]
MNKKDESKLKMGRSVSAILLSYKDIVDKTVGLGKASSILESLIEATAKHQQTQASTGTEITKMKNQIRKELERLIRKVSASLVAISIASDDEKLKNLGRKHDLPKSDLSRKKEMALFTWAYVLYGDAQPICRRSFAPCHIGRCRKFKKTWLMISISTC